MMNTLIRANPDENRMKPMIVESKSGIRHVCRHCDTEVILYFQVWRYRGWADGYRCGSCGSTFVEPIDLRPPPRRLKKKTRLK